MTAHRSRVHMLMVAAARLEQSGANPKLVTDLREAAKIESGRQAEGSAYHEDDAKRIDGHRTLMAMIYDSRAKDRLMSAMIQRAYDLMWDGDGLACDAITEFLPSVLVEKMFAAWESDQSGQTERTAFHEGKFTL